MGKFYNYDRSKEYLNKFCFAHDIELVEKGEIGFGRPCVGIYKDGCFVGYNSFWYAGGELHYYFKEDKRFEQLKTENSYHKVDCFAVICEDDVFKYRNAVIELANWIYSIEEIGKVSIKSYQSKNMNAKTFFTGDKTLYEMVFD